MEQKEYKETASLSRQSLPIRDQDYIRDYLHEIERVLNAQQRVVAASPDRPPAESADHFGEPYTLLR